MKSCWCTEYVGFIWSRDDLNREPFRGVQHSYRYCSRKSVFVTVVTSKHFNYGREQVSGICCHPPEHCHDDRYRWWLSQYWYRMPINPIRVPQTNTYSVVVANDDIYIWSRTKCRYWWCHTNSVVHYLYITIITSPYGQWELLWMYSIIPVWIWMDVVGVYNNNRTHDSVGVGSYSTVSVLVHILLIVIFVLWMGVWESEPSHVVRNTNSTNQQ